LPQWREVPGRQQQQADDRPAATPRQWGQPEAEGPTAASRPPGRARTVPIMRSSISKRVATVLFMDIILSMSLRKSQGFIIDVTTPRLTMNHDKKYLSPQALACADTGWKACATNAAFIA
jgi:hypothetical protein